MVLDLVEDWGSLPCFGHTLQLAVNAGLEIHSISRLTEVCKKVVAHFKHSVVAMTALHEQQGALNLPQHSLLQEVSTYFMYE